MEIRKGKNMISMVDLDNEDELILERILRPSRFTEVIYYKKRKNKKYFYVYFLISYGEVIIFKEKIDRISEKTYKRLIKLLINLLNKKKRLMLFVDNKFLYYERKLFNKYL